MSSTVFPKVVVRTGAALFFFWALSFALSYVGLGSASIPVALVIALTKAALVVLFFMELAHESFSLKLTLLAAAGLLATLMGLVIADVVLREPAPLAPYGSPGRPAELPSR